VTRPVIGDWAFAAARALLSALSSSRVAISVRLHPEGLGKLTMARRQFRIVLIKPSHYDRDGYVIQWWRSMIPSNSLAGVYALLVDAAQREPLGPDVDVDVEVYDECNTVIDVKAAARRIAASGGGFVGLVGVQSNQYPRAMDLARQFRALGQTVVIGGFHVSGCLSMLPQTPAELQEALDLGVILFAGEGEGRMDRLMADIDQGPAQPIYNYMDDLPSMERAVAPILPRQIVTRVATHYTSFDAGRGCPFQCSFCTIINVQGRKSRYRTADDVEAIVRANAAQGLTKFFITDDNFARNKNWEPILDRLIELRGEGLKIRIVLQVDTLCHRIPRFIEKASKAGCRSVFIGLENINPESLAGAKKRQNKIWEYRDMLLAWKRAGTMTWAGYILGFPTDTPESIARDIDTIKRELPVDILEFFCLTPLPGSEDHKKLLMAGVDMDPDLNIYDLENVATAHPVMSKPTWERVYDQAWSSYYTDEHVEAVLRRAAAHNVNLGKVLANMVVFSGAVRIEGAHPLQVGIWRRKVRTQRRAGWKIENPLVFYPRRVIEIVRTNLQWAALGLRYGLMMRRVQADPQRRAYRDEALHEATPDDDALPDFVEAFASKIPLHTHGAPARERAKAPAERVS
jgi:hypothetical protein